MEVFEHEHPLTLIDLRKVEYINYEEESADEDDSLIAEDEFRCSCKWCHQEINRYHNSYYKCTHSSCDFSLHKFCAELPITLNHTSHPQHPLIIRDVPRWQTSWIRICNICQSYPKVGDMQYICNRCSSCIDVKCAVDVAKTSIDHPCHPHPLLCVIPKPILCKCNACGKEHKGAFYQCITCAGFTIHSDCVFLPKNLLIQNTTNNDFYHTHPLTISYSFPLQDQEDKYYPRCRVCSGKFSPDHWMYKCEKCMYYAHLDCATSRKEPFMSILSLPGSGNIIKNFKDVDYPNILHLPFLDESNLPKFFGNGEANLKHIDHPHPLTLVDRECIHNVEATSSKLIMCHNPMKKIQLLCDGCLRPIMSTPFYTCANGDESCNFSLHEWCTRLPTQVENHPAHPQHTLVLMSKVPDAFFNIFCCDVCHLHCNGFAYGCVECQYYVDVNCGFIHKPIFTHKAHPNHLLSVAKVSNIYKICHMCRSFIGVDEFSKSEIAFKCSICDLYIHLACALLLPETIRHKYDKHPMLLSYLPIENHKSEYFCEICEYPMNPHRCFYHCHECVQSVHSSCAPLILECETNTFMSFRTPNLYPYVNVKFGSIHKTGGHPHPLSFAPGIASDGECSMCHSKLQYKMIFKCLKCNFAVDYECCKSLNSS